MNTEYYSIFKFYDHIAKITEEVKEWAPDYIVGLSRGGLVPAVYLSHRLAIPMHPIVWSKSEKCHYPWIAEDLNEGKKILFVDDILDSGELLRELFEDLEASVIEPLKVENIHVATLITNTLIHPIYSSRDGNVYSNYTGQFISRATNSNWFIFPWEER